MVNQIKRVMKELSTEQKAKAYDEALERARGLYEFYKDGKTRGQQFIDIFPELAESEDERIRKELIFYFQEEIPQCSIQEHADKMKEFIAWLEKQGEKKPAWSEDDEENLNWFEKFFRAESVIAEGKDIPQYRYLWFKNLKDRVQPQPKQEWSKEDLLEWIRKNVRSYVNSEYNEFHHTVEYDGSINTDKLIQDLKHWFEKK